MAPLPNTISHFMHPAHRLTQTNVVVDYICDGCKLLGTGKRFNCTICAFDLHNYCANCPPTLTSTKHPHQLHLVVHKADFTKTLPCKICLEPILCLMYECKGCGYSVHPVCISPYLDHNQPAASGSGSKGQLVSQQTVLGSNNTPGIGQQIAVGLGVRAGYDVIKQAVFPSEGNNQGDGSDQGIAQVDGDGLADGSQGIDQDNGFGLEESGGFFDLIKEGLLSLF